MGHSTPEWVYIGAVTAILIWVGAESWNIEHTLEYAPPNSETVRVVGQQWFWSFEHADGTQEINELHVKEGIPYRFEIVSNDVVHSFSIPILLCSWTLFLEELIQCGMYSTKQANI